MLHALIRDASSKGCQNVNSLIEIFHYFKDSLVNKTSKKKNRNLV